MEAAKEDGLDHPMVVRLARIGGSRHASQGLMGLLDQLGLLSLLTPLDRGGVTHLVLPSTLVAMMFRHHPDEFKKCIGADSAKLRTFWSIFLQRPECRSWADAHPGLAGKSAGDLVTTIPCSIHADAGPATKSKSATCISWSSLVSEGLENKHNICPGRLSNDAQLTTLMLGPL